MPFDYFQYRCNRPCMVLTKLSRYVHQIACCIQQVFLVVLIMSVMFVFLCVFPILYMRYNISFIFVFNVFILNINYCVFLGTVVKAKAWNISTPWRSNRGGYNRAFAHGCGKNCVRKNLETHKTQWQIYDQSKCEP